MRKVSCCSIVTLSQVIELQDFEKVKRGKQKVVLSGNSELIAVAAIFPESNLRLYPLPNMLSQHSIGLMVVGRLLDGRFFIVPILPHLSYLKLCVRGLKMGRGICSMFYFSPCVCLFSFGLGVFCPVREQL